MAMKRVTCKKTNDEERLSERATHGRLPDPPKQHTPFRTNHQNRGGKAQRGKDDPLFEVTLGNNGSAKEGDSSPTPLSRFSIIETKRPRKFLERVTQL